MTFERYKGDGTLPNPLNRRELGSYRASRQLATAVNTALAVEQPLLITGEPGTGKTTLAWSIASELGLPDVLEFHTRSDHQAKDTLYEFDNLQRFYDAYHAGSVMDLERYVRWRPLGEAIRSDTQRLVLIDEIDKAPRDFPNDLLDVIDKMEFTVDETRAQVRANVRPIVLITSNRESQLPDAFLRRCVFHHISFPSADQLKEIINERLGDLRLESKLIDTAISRFRELRGQPNLRKKPATHELITWLRVLHQAGISEEALLGPLSTLFGHSVLLKNLDDLKIVEAHLN